MTVGETNVPESRVAAPPAKPTVVFDGDCGLCRRWVERWRNLTQDRVEYIPYQEAGLRFPRISAGKFARAVHLVEPNGAVTYGAEAVLEILAITGRKWPLALYDDMPRLAKVAEWGYEKVDSHRTLFNYLDLATLGRNTLPVTHQVTRRWFLRLLSVVYIFAFISLWGQVEGLIGSKGILPIAPALKGLAAGEGGTPYFKIPTLFWINASDGMLVGVCAAGVAMAAMLLLRIVPTFAAIGAWLCYLSLMVAGQEFLALQWDALLLEAGFLAIFFSPLQLAPHGDKEPPASRLIVWLYRWLLFRVMFLSGLVKWFSAGPNWRDLTAMNYHYWTQPLPPWTAWYANQMPNWFQQLSVVGTFYCELIVPIFYFAPRQLRRWAFWFTVGFQCLILVTGNYGFFNLLTIALCVLLLDDTFWPFSWKRAERPRRKLPETKDSPLLSWIQKRIPPAVFIWIPWLRVPLAAVLIFVTTIEGFQRVKYARWIPDWATETAAGFGAFHSTNSYGLFEVMTTRRPEIIIEGSNDGFTWKEYEFKWKPGDVHRKPGFCTPHMPRLDWIPWFGGPAVMSEKIYEYPRWLLPFLKRLLEGEPKVLGLLDTNPFPDRPPRFARASMYFYQFTTPREAAKDGAWWQRRRTDFKAYRFTLLSNGQMASPDIQPGSDALR